MLDAWYDLVHGTRCLGCGRPGRPLCADCADSLPAAAHPASPTPCPAGLLPSWVAGEYDGTLRALILAHKERGVLALARPLGAVLARVVATAVATAAGPRAGSAEDAAPVVLVPVPSRAGSVRRRGHDPMLRIARVAAARLRHDGRPAMALPLLRQRLPVLDQAGLDAAARAANLADSMALGAAARGVLVRRGSAGAPGAVVVCDDVLTTGATAREAQRALAEAGVAGTAVCCLAATVRRRPGRLPKSPPPH